MDKRSPFFNDQIAVSSQAPSSMLPVLFSGYTRLAAQLLEGG